MEARLSLHQTQKLILSPQMRQYLRLLHMPIMELEQAIEQEIIENPVLDEVNAASPLEDSSPADGEDPSASSKIGELRFEGTSGPAEQLDENFQESLRDIGVNPVIL